MKGVIQMMAEARASEATSLARSIVKPAARSQSRIAEGNLPPPLLSEPVALPTRRPWLPELPVDVQDLILKKVAESHRRDALIKGLSRIDEGLPRIAQPSVYMMRDAQLKRGTAVYKLKFLGGPGQCEMWMIQCADQDISQDLCQVSKHNNHRYMSDRMTEQRDGLIDLIWKEWIQMEERLSAGYMTTHTPTRVRNWRVMMTTFTPHSPAI
jgi:hypothetical protein